MKLTIFAATGGIGRQLLRQAVAAGHEVTAVVRDPNAFRGEVRTVRTDLLTADIATVESMLRATELDWTSVGVPLLNDDPPTGTYRVAVGEELPRAHRLARADAAACMLATLEQPATIRQTLAVAY